MTALPAPTQIGSRVATSARSAVLLMAEKSGTAAIPGELFSLASFFFASWTISVALLSREAPVSTEVSGWKLSAGGSGGGGGEPSPSRGEPLQKASAMRSSSRAESPPSRSICRAAVTASGRFSRSMARATAMALASRATSCRPSSPISLPHRASAVGIDRSLLTMAAAQRSAASRSSASASDIARSMGDSAVPDEPGSPGGARRTIRPV
jgi:hypothetical protein